MRKNGFTIVELLIVVVIIGILAAIVVVAYNGLTRTARESAIESDLANFAKKAEVYKAMNGQYPANASQLDSMEFSLNQEHYVTGRNNFYYCRKTDDLQQYAVGAITTTGTNYYIVNGTVTSQSGGISGATTCDNLPTPTSWSGTAGHSETTGWQTWTE